MSIEIRFLDARGGASKKWLTTLRVVTLLIFGVLLVSPSGAEDDPSLEDTLDFIKRITIRDAFDWHGRYESRQLFNNDLDIAIGDCTLDFSYKKIEYFGGEPSFGWTVKFQLKLERFSEMRFRRDTGRLDFVSRNRDIEQHNVENIEGEPDSVEIRGQVGVGYFKVDIADRMIIAYKHAAKLCGAKEEPF